MTTEQEKAQLRSIVQSPQWQTVLAFAENLCASIKTEPHTYDTEWESIRDTLIDEGQVRGIKNLLQSLQRDAFQDKDAE